MSRHRQTWVIGSSPRARGAHGLGRAFRQRGWIIPACTGSTAARLPPPACVPDHPRVHGEHAIRALRPRLVLGSSPRARGALDPGECAPGLPRIIPACTGSTRLAPERVDHRADHPRVHGEHVPSWFSVSAVTGSSPRARGAPPPLLARGGASRIIPACTGSTPGRSAGPMPAADHPRVHGEHHARHAGGRRGCRIIPACTGSTMASVERTIGDAGSSPRARGALVDALIRWP